MDRLNKLYLEKLKAAALSNTKPRKAVFMTLSDSNHRPLTMQELIKRTKTLADRASVYRAVEALETANVLHKIHTGWKYKLELSDDFHGHHHHLICSNCHDIVIAQENYSIEKEIEKIGKESGFLVNNHSLEIYGLCKKCSKKHGTPG